MTGGESFSFGILAMLVKCKLEIITNKQNMERIDNVHPGEVLLEEFLIPLDITAYRLSKDLEIPQTRVSEILKGRRRITADTALRLSKYFGNSPKFWLGLQDDYDLEEEIQARYTEFQKIKKREDYAA
jgi:addiction module HigA family antidote